MQFGDTLYAGWTASPAARVGAELLGAGFLAGGIVTPERFTAAIVSTL
ncbi:MAG TPA: hypothetical protein VFA45_21295 [Actinomycetes bacterium]|nr:hypothetical protein [Actinomycetes bacterium]